ncbi:MAG: type II secretion system protein M [Oscillospiraceae bacterium]|jgi:hypothetical protein|nr:type II secretion system protein M [Oscillospiraceae bacterium]
MLSKSFTNREKLLVLILCILMLIAFYYFAIQKPVTESIEAAEEEYTQLQDELMVETAKAAQLMKMRTELKEAGYEDGVESDIPYYDNIQNLVKQLDTVLNGVSGYQISFSNPAANGNLATRGVSLSFSSPNYAAARSIITNLYSGPYRCAVTSMQLSPSGSELTDGAVAVSLSLIFFEYVMPTTTDAATAETSAAS